MKNKIYYYSNSRGDEVVNNFISSLDISTRAKTMRMVDLLETFGHQLSLPYCKKVSRNLYELRIRGKNHVRIFYAFVGNEIIMLHGIKKKSDKLPKKYIELAQQRYDNVVDK